MRIYISDYQIVFKRKTNKAREKKQQQQNESHTVILSTIIDRDGMLSFDGDSLTPFDTISNQN